MRLAKTVMFSSLFYGPFIWKINANMLELNKLCYKVAKSAVGAVLNVQNAILEVILGIPPLRVTNIIISVKHYLKVFSRVHMDVHHDFIYAER